ncbi:MAG TPA: hypothetical protein DEA80_26300 [Afipia sp.]|uniref:hypothetical protein n=1 Tax=unclassified Afipia TaxID=2642050 RepID=UPI000466EAFA|nr:MULTISPECIES: hypothetical protein [unclassified Afipia]HBF55920.1 hypothetical protein [Afipia sp.]HBR48396.1 hypothetical protein [Afipia sp.]|tara:strand:- start:52 stop:474 length:423 start_codon:yes stop_codon:yes gene_type:complete
MKTFILSGLLMCAAGVAVAADVTAICKLGDDKRTVTVAFTNPESKTMQCEVNCDMALPGGFGTVVCVKPVPGGAKDQVMCTDVSKGSAAWVRVKGTEVNCRDPNGTPVTPADDKSEEEESDALIKRLQKQGQDFIDRQKK